MCNCGIQIIGNDTRLVPLTCKACACILHIFCHVIASDYLSACIFLEERLIVGLRVQSWDVVELVFDCLQTLLLAPCIASAV